MNPWALLGGVAVWLGSVAGAYLYGHTAGENSQIAQRVRDEHVATVAAEAAASAIAASIPKITVQHRTVRQEVEREIQTRDVYRDPDCRTGADSLRLFNSTIPGYATSSVPNASSVPAADASD